MIDHDVPVTSFGARDSESLDDMAQEPDRQLSLDPESAPDMPALVEALLLVAPEPATMEELAHGAGVSVAAIEAALETLETVSDRGWVVQRHRGTVQLASAPRFAEQVRRFLNLDRETRLSTAALETLAIIAYQQPVTRTEIEAVRGVDCAGVLATLHHRGLIEAVGRLLAAGSPFQYGTTVEFLRHFGLQSLDDLPPLGEVGGRDANGALDAAVAAAVFAPTLEQEDSAPTTAADARNTELDTGWPPPPADDVAVVDGC